MKKTLLTLFMALSAFAAVEAQSVENAAGKYCGELYVSLGAPVDENAAVMPNQTVDINASETAGAVDFALYNFGFLGLPLGNIELPAVGFSLEGQDGTFAENSARFFSFLSGQIEATALLNHTTSYVKGDSLVVNIDVVWTNGDNLPIYVRFKGVKLEPTNIQPLAGLYNGKFTIMNEDESAILSEQDTVKLDLAVTGTNSASLTMGEVTVQDSINLNFVFNPAFRNGADNVAELIPAEAAYMFFCKEKQAIVNMYMGDCTLNAEGMTLKFLVTTDEATYSCTYTATLDIPAGIHTATTPDRHPAAYTLDGRRVNSSNLTKGIYVVNGKKIMIK